MLNRVQSIQLKWKIKLKNNHWRIPEFFFLSFRFLSILIVKIYAKNKQKLQNVKKFIVHKRQGIRINVSEVKLRWNHDNKSEYIAIHMAEGIGAAVDQVVHGAVVQ